MRNKLTIYCIVNDVLLTKMYHNIFDEIKTILIKKTPKRLVMSEDEYLAKKKCVGERGVFS